MSGPLQLRFLQSASKHTQLPESVAEVAFAGRSNVGKSSLLNAVAHRKNLAKTSKTPGATQLLNAFELAPEDSGLWVVDLPGYGFAKAPEHARERWARMIENYLLERESLVAVMLLIDGLVGPTDLDKQSIDWFHHIEVPINIVATKHDKVKPSKLGARKRDLAVHSGVRQDEVRWVSAAKGTGVGELRGDIRRLLGAS